jgi:anaerobic selenocysteine-containing dehydrogenase
MKRREFIILTSVGAATTTLLSACGHPENKLIPVFIPDDEYVPGLDYWKATSCRMCGGGCGIIVRTREHKANKIEGNPFHPVNRGALCARGQAGLQLHYNPDRIRGPKKRDGDRGSGQFTDISWDEAIKTLTDRLRELRSPSSNPVVLAAHRSDGVTGLVAEHLMDSVGSLKLAADQFPGQFIEAASYRESYGGLSLPVFDIANARYLLSFGARFLETWHSPVMYSLAYAEFRRGDRHGRGRFVQVEPRMSMTAANADLWLPAAPGTEGLVALGIAQVILRESLVPGASAPSFLHQPIDDFAPDRTASQTGIPPEKVINVAREFAAERGLAIAGGSALAVAEAADNIRAINFLNILVGNLDHPGGVLSSADPSFDPFHKWRRQPAFKWSPLPEQFASAAAPAAILFYHSNPVFTAPWLADAIKAVPFIASFSTFMDESTMLADLILPDNSNFESWDLGASRSVSAAGASPILPSPGLESSPAVRNAGTANQRPATPVLIPVVTLTRPVLSTAYNTRQTADILIAVSKDLAGDMSRILPFGSAEEIVKAAAAELQELPGSVPDPAWVAKQDSGSNQEGDAASQFWNKFYEAGVWIGAPAPSRSRQPADGSSEKVVADRPGAAPVREPDPQFPLTLLAYDHPALGYGAEANLPWLQELPEPMTTVMWGSWVEINPKTAASYSIEDGDLVEVRSASGSVRAPALIYPAIHPDLVAMPHGQGHTAYGMYAAGRGANAAQLSPVLPRLSGQAETIRVSISKVPGATNLIRFGTMLPERPERGR